MNTEAMVDYFLGGHLRGGLTDKSLRFERLLFQVLVAIWGEVEEKAEEELGLILFVDGSSLFRFTESHHYSPNSELARKKQVCTPLGKWIIFFPESLVNESDQTVKYVVAHEFAHFMLGHDGGASRPQHKKGERAADELAAKWGFVDSGERMKGE